MAKSEFRIRTLNWFIEKYGEEEGRRRYEEKSKASANTLENYIKKYGEKEGTKRYNDIKNRFKGRFTKEWFVNKYGYEEGIKKYKQKNQLCSGSLETFIKRYGEIEGKKKYDNFRQKCIVRPEIKNNPNSEYNNRKFATTLDYWLEKCNGDIEKAKQKLKERQNTSSLNKFIRKYGLENGTNQYIETCRKKLWKFNPYSKMSTNFIEELLILVKNYNFKKIYYGENEYVFLINDESIKIAKPDLYIKDINLIIEFYGDYFHRNPKIYKNVIDDKKYKIWEYDEKRIKLIRKKYNCTIMIVWELDYHLQKEKILNEIKNKIKQLYERNF